MCLLFYHHDANFQRCFLQNKSNVCYVPKLVLPVERIITSPQTRPFSLRMHDCPNGCGTSPRNTNMLQTEACTITHDGRDRVSPATHNRPHLNPIGKLHLGHPYRNRHLPKSHSERMMAKSPCPAHSCRKFPYSNSRLDALACKTY